MSKLVIAILVLGYIAIGGFEFTWQSYGLSFQINISSLSQLLPKGKMH